MEESKTVVEAVPTKRTKKSLWEILVPVAVRGQQVKLIKHQQWDKKINEISGGLSFMKPMQGYWRDNSTGRVIKDSMIPVRIMCTAKEINDVADFTAKHYNQSAVMFYKITNDVKIKKYEK